MDSRYLDLAEQLVRHSTSLKKGEKILLDLVDTPEEMGVALIRAVRKRKGIPFVRLGTNRLSRELLMGATDDQYATTAKHLMTEMKDMDAYIAIRGSHNITESSDVPAKQMGLSTNHLRKVIDHRVKKTEWGVLRWPHAAMAQQSGMSTEAFEDFYFRVCLLDYKSFVPAMNALKRFMEKTDEVHILGKGTDLKFSLKGMSAIACGGENNIPDGEVFSAPVKDSVEGVNSYNTPTVYRGMNFDGIEFTFEKGKIVKALAANGMTKELNKICLLYTSPSPRDKRQSRMPSSA